MKAPIAMTDYGSLKGDELRMGAWLCEEGPYRECIEALSDSNPGLRKPDPSNKDNHPLKTGNATVVMLELPKASPSKFEKTQFRHSPELKKHLEISDADGDRRRVYILEGLAQDYISVLGSHFDMDPSFFLRQERTCVWSNNFTPTSDALPQPSLLQPETSFMLQYCELRQFDRIMSNAAIFCHRTGRHVGMTPPRINENTTTGILRRKMSYWCRQTNGGGWDVVILCDPQLNELWVKEQRCVDVQNSAFQGGYIDFLPRRRYDPSEPIARHPHHSMLRDLCYYYENHSGSISEQQWRDPLAASLFPKKIVAAYYLQLADYIKAMLPSLELHITSGWIEEEDQWRSLQTISRRCGNYRDDVEDTLLSLGYGLDEPNSRRVGDWKDCEKDFQYIYLRLKVLKQRADTLMSAMTGLASIAGNRQSLEEAKRVKRLTLIGLIFIPLAYASSLFGMSDNFVPGQEDFWVYWVTALPMALGLLLVTYALDWMLDENTAQWTLERFKFWKKHDKSLVVRKQRRGTGVWKNPP